MPKMLQAWCSILGTSLAYFWCRFAHFIVGGADPRFGGCPPMLFFCGGRANFKVRSADPEFLVMVVHVLHGFRVPRKWSPCTSLFRGAPFSPNFSGDRVICVPSARWTARQGSMGGERGDYEFVSSRFETQCSACFQGCLCRGLLGVRSLAQTSVKWCY